MGNKWKQGQTELFDGQAVEKYQLSFTGSFSDEEVDVDALAMDDHICLMVIAVVGEAVMKKNKEDEVVRTNKLQVLRAVELDPQVADYALAKQAASNGTPMLPNFSDPDDDDDDVQPLVGDPQPAEVADEPDDLEAPYEVLPG